MTTDEQLLQQYAREDSESAFGELVTRHIDFVHSAALRVVNGDTHLAQDVTQTVFIDLARKAGNLPRGVVLTGWLHRHTCYTAATAVRTERRRHNREQTAMEMRALDDNTRPEWEMVAPYLDEGLNRLNPTDRDALVLRFLKQQDLRTVGEALGISEDAAQKRVDRALEKLHVFLEQRGATLTAAALGTMLATEGVTAAPAGLAGSVTAAALASAAAGSVASLGILKTMTLAKLAIGISGAILVGALAVFLFREEQSQSRLRDENQALQSQIRQLDRLVVENQSLSNQLLEAKSAREKLPGEQFRELLKLRGEVGVLRRQNADPKETQITPPEPVFEGKPLTAWIEELWRMTSPGSHDSRRSGPGADALRALGTNAVPYLIHMLTTKRPHLSDLPTISARNEAVRPASYTTAADSVIRAATACELLGPKAGGAIPALIPLLEDQDAAIRAQVVAALCFIQQDADIVVPLLAERLDDTDPRVQSFAFAGLPMFGAKARPALPALRKVAESQERELSVLAADSIRKIENAPAK